MTLVSAKSEVLEIPTRSRLTDCLGSCEAGSCAPKVMGKLTLDTRMSDYALSSIGQVVSSKSSLKRIIGFSFCLVVLGMMVLFHSTIIIYDQRQALHMQISKAYFALPASLIVICAGLLVITAELRYPTKVMVSQKGVKFSKGHSSRESPFENDFVV